MATDKRKPKPARKARPPASASLAPAGSMTFRGATRHFKVSYLSSLGNDGIYISDALLQSCEGQYQTLRGWFGGSDPDDLPFNVEVTDGAKGASHPACRSTTITVGGRSDASTNLDFMRMLLFAEVAEVLMHKQGRYWDCQASNGEALSRVLSADLCLGADPVPSKFLSAPVWLANREANWIDRTERTDQDETANGCGVLFLNWLRFARGFSWASIISASEDTLAETYQRLTGSATAWTDFRAVVDARFPTNKPVRTDNPFRGPPRAAGYQGSPCAPDPALADALKNSLVDAFGTVLGKLRAEGCPSNEKPYLFPDGINDIEFELKVGDGSVLSLSVKIQGTKS
jgi:hypothetical protein